MRIQPAISSRVRRQPAQWPLESSAQMLMQGDMGRARRASPALSAMIPSLGIRTSEIR
jgi:hypothetical protein